MDITRFLRSSHLPVTDGHFVTTHVFFFAVWKHLQSICWVRNIPGGAGQYHSCWFNGSLRCLTINNHISSYAQWTDLRFACGRITSTHFNVELWNKIQICFMLPHNNSTCIMINHTEAGGACMGQLYNWPSVWLCSTPSHNLNQSRHSVNRVLLRLNTLRTRQNGRHFPDDIVKCNFLNVDV